MEAALSHLEVSDVVDSRTAEALVLSALAELE